MKPIEVIFLDRTNGRMIDTKFQGFFEHVYEVDPDKLLKWAMKKSLLKKSDYIFNINQATLPVLKEVLSEHNLNITGKKSSLIESILENIPKETLRNIFNQSYYQLTDEGLKAVAENEYAVFYHKNKYIQSEITLDEFYQYVKKDKSNYLNFAIQIFESKLDRYRYEGSWGEYRNNLFTIAEFYSLSNNIEKALELLSKSNILDMSGLSNNNSYSTKEVYIAPGVYKLINKYLKAGNFTTDYFIGLSIKSYKDLQLPKCKLNLEDINKITLAALNNFEDGETILKKCLRQLKEPQTKSENKIVSTGKQNGLISILKRFLKL